MRKKYYFRQIFCALALFMSGMVVAQTPAIPELDQIEKPVLVNGSTEAFPFFFQAVISTGDYNNDGYLDIFSAGFGHSWSRHTYLNKKNQEGTFTPTEHPLPALESGSALWLYYNNDGNLDLFLTGNTEMGKYAALWKNLGAAGNYEFEEVFIGEFEPMYNGGGNRTTRCSAAGDYDNDGWVDILVQGDSGKTRRTILYKNNAGQGFIKQETPVAGTKNFVQMNGGGLGMADFNGDGYLDIVTAGYNSKNDEHDGVPCNQGWNFDAIDNYAGFVYLNNGDGTFKDNPFHFAGTEEGNVIPCDYNNDGNLDFLVCGVGWFHASYLGRFANDDWKWLSDIYMGDGNGNFTVVPSEVNGMPNNRQSTSQAMADINNDGFEDIMYVYAQPNSLFLNNYGDDSFTKFSPVYKGIEIKENDVIIGYKSEPMDANGGGVAIFDFDNDGNLDVITSGYGGNYVMSLLKNKVGEDVLSKNGLNLPPSAPTGLQSSVVGSNVSFSWNPVSDDDHTSKEVMRYNLYVKKDGASGVIAVLPVNITTGKLSVNDDMVSILGTSYKINGLKDGKYTVGVQAIDNGKLTSPFATTTFEIGSGSYLKEFKEDVINIQSGKGTITLAANTDAIGTIEVYGVGGACVYSSIAQINGAVINLPAGVYMVKVTSEVGFAVKKAIVK